MRTGSAARRLALACVLAVSGIAGALLVVFSGHPGPPTVALKPIQPAPTVSPAAPGTRSGDESERAGVTASAAAPAVDWWSLVQPYLQSQADAAPTNIAAAGVGSGAANSASAAVSDLILYAAYSGNGPELLSELQNALPPLTGQSSVTPLPDLSGLLAALTATAPPGAVAAPGRPDSVPRPVLVPPALPTLPPLPAMPDLQLPTLAPPPPVGLPAIGFPSSARSLGVPY